MCRPNCYWCQIILSGGKIPVRLRKKFLGKGLFRPFINIFDIPGPSLRHPTKKKSGISIETSAPLPQFLGIGLP